MVECFLSCLYCSMFGGVWVCFYHLAVRLGWSSQLRSLSILFATQLNFASICCLRFALFMVISCFRAFLRQEDNSRATAKKRPVCYTEVKVGNEPYQRRASQVLH